MPTRQEKKILATHRAKKGRMISLKKVIVIGCPGSGKSTFSKALAQKTGLPLHHLDLMYWNGDKTTVEKSVFLARLSQVLSGEEWIIDGNYASTLELRLAACDTVFFFDLPREVCLAGVRARQGKQRSDMPWVETEEDEEFLRFITEYREKERPRVLSLLGAQKGKSIRIFQSRKEADAALAEFHW